MIDDEGEKKDEDGVNADLGSGLFAGGAGSKKRNSRRGKSTGTVFLCTASRYRRPCPCPKRTLISSKASTEPSPVATARLSSPAWIPLLSGTKRRTSLTPTAIPTSAMPPLQRASSSVSPPNGITSKPSPPSSSTPATPSWCLAATTDVHPNKLR